MLANIPEQLTIIAGNGIYPRLLAESARKQGVKYILTVAFRWETDRIIEKFSDKTIWIRLGELQAMLDAIASSGIKTAVMAGQITPTHLFTVRMDSAMLNLLRGLKIRNAETIFSAVANELSSRGVSLIPASTFMEDYMPSAGVLTKRQPTDSEWNDIQIGFRAAKIISQIDIGQTVVVKEGVILAVEAFEGTNSAILRAAKLGGKGSVIVKVAKKEHDMRFDIPVIGTKTIKILKKARAAVLAFEAGRAIILEKDIVINEANKIGVSLVSSSYFEQ